MNRMARAGDSDSVAFRHFNHNFELQLWIYVENKDYIREMNRLPQFQ